MVGGDAEVGTRVGDPSARYGQQFVDENLFALTEVADRYDRPALRETAVLYHRRPSYLALQVAKGYDLNSK